MTTITVYNTLTKKHDVKTTTQKIREAALRIKKAFPNADIMTNSHGEIVVTNDKILTATDLDLIKVEGDK